MARYRNERVANTGVDTSDWLVLGSGGEGRGADKIGIQVEASGTAIITIEATLNADLIDGTDTVPAAEINDIASMVGLTANGMFEVSGPIKAIRINQTAGAGTSAITVLQLA